MDINTNEPLQQPQQPSGSPQFDYQRQELAKAIKFQRIAFYMALISLLIGGCLLDIAAFICIFIGHNKVKTVKLVLQGYTDPGIEQFYKINSMFKKRALIACCLALALNIVSIIIAFPTLMAYYEEIGLIDVSALTGGTGTAFSW